MAEEYLNYLYSDEAQRIAGDNYYRPSNQDILKEYSDVFDWTSILSPLMILVDGKRHRKHISQMEGFLIRFTKDRQQKI